MVVNQVKFETTEATPILELKMAVKSLTLFVQAEATKHYLEKVEKERKEREQDKPDE